MPRIYCSRSDPHDFCRACFPKTELLAFELFGGLGDGPDGRGNCFGYDAEHPPYVDENYPCEKCGGLLGEVDDEPDPLTIAHAVYCSCGAHGLIRYIPVKSEYVALTPGWVCVSDRNPGWTCGQAGHTPAVEPWLRHIAPASASA